MVSGADTGLVVSEPTPMEHEDIANGSAMAQQIVAKRMNGT